MARSCCVLLLLLGACGPSGKPGTTTGNVDPGDHACPPAEMVRLASWQSVDGGGYGGEGYGTPQTAHWQVPLAVYTQTYGEDGEVTSTPQAPGPRTEAEVRALIKTPLAAEAWIYGNGAAEPCQAKVVGYYLTNVPGDAVPFDVLAAQVAGCPYQGDWRTTSFAVIGANPTGCALALPEAVASRDGEYPEVPDDEQRAFQMPTDADVLPPVIAGAVKPPACETPPCRPLWLVRRAGVPGQYVYDVSTMWLTPGEPGDECSWPTSTARELYLGGDVASSKAPIMVDGMNWETGEPALEEAAVELVGVLHDRGGARLVLTVRPGQYGVHELDGTKLGAGAMHDWYVPHEEDYMQPLLGPACGL